MSNGCKNKQDKNKRYIWMVGILIAIFLQMYLEKVWDPYWAWFIAGSIMGVSVQLGYPVKRHNMLKLGIVVFGGIVTTAIYYFGNMVGI